MAFPTAAITIEQVTSQKALADRHNLPPYTVSRIMSTDLRGVYNSNMQRRAPQSKFKAINEAIVPYYHERLDAGIRVTSADLIREGQRQAQPLGRTDFRPSQGWVTAFRNRYTPDRHQPWKKGVQKRAAESPQEDQVHVTQSTAAINDELVDHNLEFNLTSAPLMPQNVRTTVVTLSEFLKQREQKLLSITLIRQLALALLSGLKEREARHSGHSNLNLMTILLTDSHLPWQITVMDSVAQAYHSPEMHSGLPLTIASQMWSLGCILAELLLGQQLYPQFSHAKDLHLDPSQTADGLTHQMVAQVRSVSSFTGLDGAAEKADIYTCVLLVKALLNPDPQQRLSLADTLKHPFLTREHLTALSFTISYEWCKKLVEINTRQVLLLHLSP
ncbi:hypothetical protein BV898_00573 [Hypsibius exemplaris]|uniref:HTH CENPB-type domain-containing protein n=1 Tax=Hypsibius exemplaris TaxID=2072580 RepID=A0A1W0XDZ9_HYPEX|nr:hypothetical protein BV898_00573 [Hypsibius exemplaris]